jgi:chemotaxis signal transduction protein
MKVARESLASHLVQLKDEFDRSFALPASFGSVSGQALLALRIGEARLAVPLADIEGVALCPNLVQLPSRAPELLGIAGFRGELIPVFSLAKLIGYSPPPAPVRWLLLCGGERLGLAFSRVDGHYSVAPGALKPVSASETRSPHTSHVASLDGAACPVLSVASILRQLAEPNPKELQP